MKNKKGLALLLSAALLFTTAMPGTLAISSSTASSATTLTTASEPDATPDTEPDAAPDATVAPDATPVPDAVETPAPSETPVPAGDGDFASLTVEEQFNTIIAIENEDDAQALLDTLSEEQLTELLTYAEQTLQQDGTGEEESGPAVNYTNVAPLVKNEEPAAAAVAPVNKVRRLAAARTTDPIAPTLSDGTSADGLELSKKAEANTDGSYKITLEAYTTGQVTTSDTTKPTDIVCVLDQSGSMAKTMTQYTYGEAYSLDTSNTYYVYENGSYVEVTWCSKCSKWTKGCLDFIIHIPGTSCTPKNDSNDQAEGHVQFYARTGSTEEIKLDALKDAMTNFADSVQAKAAGADKNDPSDDVNHRIAIVGFSSDDYNNTELLTGCDIETGDQHNPNIYLGDTPYYYPTSHEKNGIQYDSSKKNGGITAAQYAAALQDMSTAAGVQNVDGAIDALTAHGGTYTLDGLDMAAQIFENSGNATNRNRVVILFTDGDTDSYRDNVINKAYALKNTYGATVYTIGIFTDADGEPPIKDKMSDANKLMHRVSSNYPSATASRKHPTWTPSFINPYTYNDGDLNKNLTGDDTYFLSAGDADALNNIFQKISQQISQSTIDLGSSTQIKDVVSPYFTVPTEGNVIVQSYNCTGYTNGQPTWATDGTTLTNAVEVENDTITVTGFDFNQNFVAENARKETEASDTEDFHGRKLVITFTVSPKDGFWGGNNVPTNGDTSGVYSGSGTPVATFRVPTVNVPLSIPNITAVDKNIYLLNTAPTASDLGSFSVPAGDDAWKIAYVNVGDLTADRTISNTEDTTDITLSVTVTPKYTGADADVGTAVTATTKTSKANVYVYKPELTFKDSSVYYGDNEPDYRANYLSTAWKHETTYSTGVTMEGTAPTLDIAYTPEEGKIVGDKINTKNDIAVNATVKIGNTNVTSHSTFAHQACGPACGWDKLTTKPAFLLHVNTCSLTISKTGGAEGEPYVFKVYKQGTDGVYTEVSVTGNNNVTIYELPVGTYFIEEDTGWSWRYPHPTYQYGTDENATNITLSSSGNTTGTITCTNEQEKPYWLNGFSEVVKNIYGGNQIHTSTNN